MKNNTKKNLRFWIIICLSLCGFICLAGTAVFFQEQYTKAFVTAYVKKQCPEDFEIISSKQIAENPKITEYTFETTGRKLRFTATSRFHSNSVFPAIECHYNNAPRYLYASRIYEELLQCSCYNKSSSGPFTFPDSPFISFYIGSYSDLEEAAATLDKCNQIYAEELAYNSQSFLEENPVSKVHIELEMNGKTRLHITNSSIFTGAIDGNTEELLPTLSLAYAQIFKNHPDADSDDIPEKYMNMVHVSKLEITLNNTELNSHDYGHCWYNYDSDSYMIYLFYHNSSFLLCDYMELLHTDYTFDSGRATLQWKTKNNSWQLNRKKDEDGNLIRQGIEITKNGKILPDIVEAEDNGYILVSIPLDDFASMLDLKYTIKEEDSSISFTSTDKNES